MTLFYRRNFVSLLLLMAMSYSAFSQTPVFSLTEYKEKYSEETVINLKSVSKYRFEQGTAQNPMVVIVSNSDKYMSLRPKVGLKDAIFYDKYSEITEHKLSRETGPRPFDYVRCGDFERDGLFYHDAQICVFDMHFAEAGNSYTLNTEKRINDLRYFTTVPLHKAYRTLERKVSIVLPDYLQLEIFEMNFGQFDIESTRVRDSIGRLTTIEYMVRDLPAMQKVENMPEYSCAMPHLLVVPRSYVKGTDTIAVLKRPENLYNWYVSLISEPSVSPELAAFTDNLVKNDSTADQKISSIMRWIADKVRYIAFVNGMAAYVPDEADVVFKNRYGDCKGMSNLARSMLRHLGIDARLGWVYSGKTCYPEETLSLASDNHMICVVKQDNELIYLDPTLRYAALREIPENIQGKRCVVEDGKGWAVERIPATGSNSNLKSISNQLVIDGSRFRVDGNIMLKGDIKLMFQHFLNHIRSDKKEDLLRYFVKGGDNNFRIIEMNTPRADSAAENFEIRYNLEVSNALIDLGDEMLLSMDFWKELKGQKIEKDRKYNYNLKGRNLTEHKVRLRLPDHLKVKKLPEPLHISMPGYNFSGSYMLEGNEIVYRKKIEISSEVLKPEDFESWNESIVLLTRFYNEMVVLISNF
jgi:hypothetical protein